MDGRKDEAAGYATFDALLERLLVKEAGGDVARARGMVDDYVAKMVAGTISLKTAKALGRALPPD